MPSCENGARHVIDVGTIFNIRCFYCDPCKLSFPEYTWRGFQALADPSAQLSQEPPDTTGWPEIVYTDILDAEVIEI